MTRPQTPQTRRTAPFETSWLIAAIPGSGKSVSFLLGEDVDGLIPEITTDEEETQ